MNHSSPVERKLQVAQTYVAEYPFSSEYPVSSEYPISSGYPISSDDPFEFWNSDSIGNALKQGECSEEQKRKFFLQLAGKPIPVWKRTFDITVSIGLAILLSPLLIGIAVFIRLVSGGPVLFRQKRLGEMGKDFDILKFRTLYPSLNATEDHRKFVSSLTRGNQVIRKPELDKRMIPGGKFLRSTSLDELPQLLNIIRGEMSLIGPRPDVLHWNDYESSQLKRFEVRPGITGLWQVSGKNKLTFDQMISLDVKYVESRSLRLDLWIVFKTIGVVFRGSNR